MWNLLKENRELKEQFVITQDALERIKEEE